MPAVLDRDARTVVRQAIRSGGFLTFLIDDPRVQSKFVGISLQLFRQGMTARPRYGFIPSVPGNGRRADAAFMILDKAALPGLPSMLGTLLPEAAHQIAAGKSVILLGRKPERLAKLAAALTADPPSPEHRHGRINRQRRWQRERR